MDEQQLLGSNGDHQQGQHGGLHDDVEGKIFVGGLSWQTTEESMRFHFEKFGELSDIAIMIDKRTGQPRGFGFITMKDPAAADIVVSTEHTIDGRVVDVKRAVPRDMAPAPTRAEAKKIFVGGLPTEVTEKEFADYFGTFGLVKDVVVMVDRATNRSRGFGFVTFETEEAVEAVMRNKCEMMGKWVEVKRAEPRDSRDNMRGGIMGGPMGMPMGMQMGAYNGMNGGGRGGMGAMGGRGGQMGGGFGQPTGGRGVFGGRGGMQDFGSQQHGYGSQQPYGGQGFGGRGGGGPASGGYGAVRYPAGYGGSAAGGMGRSALSAGGGYSNPAAMYAQQSSGVGYYAGYGYGGAASQSMAGAYGGQVGGGATRGAGGLGGDEGGSAGQYGNAADMQQYSYGAAAMAGYGGAYNAGAGYGGSAGAGIPGLSSQQGAQAGVNRGGLVSQDASFNETGYGAYRGQGAAQGRVDRSYRPY